MLHERVEHASGQRRPAPNHAAHQRSAIAFHDCSAPVARKRGKRLLLPPDDGRGVIERLLDLVPHGTNAGGRVGEQRTHRTAEADARRVRRRVPAPGRLARDV